MSPRCGVPDQSHDDHNKLHTAKHYSFLKGRPSWNHSIVPLMLNYALSQERIIDYINISDIRVALERAFSTWSSVIPVDFTETRDYEHANITIGFYYGDHGDGDPFHDRVLGHATGPGPGAHLHFNAAKTWAVDFNSEKSKNAYYDLESTAVHEIGHLLGLDHSNISKAIMWPYGGAREKHVDLSLDDVNGAQALYGANPNFKLDSLNRKQAVASSEFLSGLSRNGPQSFRLILQKFKITSVQTSESAFIMATMGMGFHLVIWFLHMQLVRDQAHIYISTQHILGQLISIQRNQKVPMIWNPWRYMKWGMC
ncbi:hypothetical protein MKW92_029497 [Papaver armeniacum]|nr:hypothetical protein MKW92_029497 [Papaver armeniacum]